MADTLRDLLRASSLPRLEARMLWQHVLQVPRAWLIAHDTDIPAAQQLQAYRALEARRLDGEPMAYILGAREFMGHEFSVTPDVLIPRPETELLVEVALDYLDGLAARPSRSLQPTTASARLLWRAGMQRHLARGSSFSAVVGTMHWWMAMAGVLT
jgi:methylase of polypeptide subunit release factors